MGGVISRRASLRRNDQGWRLTGRVVRAIEACQGRDVSGVRAQIQNLHSFKTCCFVGKFGTSGMTYRYMVADLGCKEGGEKVLAKCWRHDGRVVYLPVDLTVKVSNERAFRFWEVQWELFERIKFQNPDKLYEYCDGVRNGKYEIKELTPQEELLEGMMKEMPLEGDTSRAAELARKFARAGDSLADAVRRMGDAAREAGVSVHEIAAGIVTGKHT